MENLPGVTPMQPYLCPHCGYLFDSITTDDGAERVPDDGDVSVCINCAEALTFWTDLTFGLRLRAMTPEEAADFAAGDEWSDVRAFQAHVRKRNNAEFGNAPQSPERMH